MSVSDSAWQAIFKEVEAWDHDFSNSPLTLTAKQIKDATKGKSFKTTGEREPRILCKQDSREDRPKIFLDPKFGKSGLFILPIINGSYALVKGEGYLDIAPEASEVISYKSALDFELKSAEVGNSEMQHIDFAYAVSVLRTFFEDKSLTLTIRGRKYTPPFSFKVGEHRHTLSVDKVQTEVDAGYEGRNQIVLLEAKNSKTKNVILRQLFYPYRQWSIKTGKKVRTAFFEKRKSGYAIWEYGFEDDDYNSAKLIKSAIYSVSG